VAGAVEYLEGMGEKLGEGVERFDGTFGTTGKIEDEGKVACDGDAAGQHSGGRQLGASAAHLFGQAGDYFLGDVERGFGSVVAGTEAGATGSENQINAAGIRKLAEMRANLAGVIGAF